MERTLRAALAGIALYAAYFALMSVSPGGAGLGFGDVKLAGGLGVLLGRFSWQTVLGGTLYAFVMSGLWAVGLLATGKANRHSHFAFGPFMIVGAVLLVLAR